MSPKVFFILQQIICILQFQSKGWEVQENSTKRFMRPKSTSNVGPRPRPKTIHLSEVDSPGAGRTGIYFSSSLEFS